MSDGLLPCPFCGGWADVAQDACEHRCFVQCRDCFASTVYGPEDLVVAAWNRRAVPAAAAVCCCGDACNRDGSLCPECVLALHADYLADEQRARVRLAREILATDDAHGAEAAVAWLRDEVSK